MEIAILGPLEVRGHDGRTVEITGARLRTLLLRLALDAGRPVAPATLVDAVWGEAPPAEATNALQTLVSRLRRALGAAGVVEQSPAGYRLALDPLTVDAHRFTALADRGARELRSGEPAAAARTLREGLALWRGAALADAPAGLEAFAARLDEQRVAAVVDRVSADIALGDAEIAVPELEALAGEFPLDERIAAQLVTALASSGRQAEALRAYERVRERLADELGVDPSAELREVHLAVLRGEVEGAGPVPRRRTNLKSQLTSFVGRDDQVAGVAKALESNRLVTIVGPGGAGKTRLAAEAGAGLDARDGVWLAELAPVSDPAAVPLAVLGALGFREKQLLDRRPARAGQDAATRVVEALGDKHAVLVLDNCEHLVDAAAALAEDLLQQCPQLRVLATSREPLAITGEVVLALPSLSSPPLGSPPADAVQYPAVRLFADRAAAARPGFTVDDSTVAVVVDIVRRLDGLPLAIELAAARLRTLPVGEVAARLDDRFRLLTGGSRTALPRHRTLRAVVEWSWELLSAPERRLVERLAIFPAGVVEESATSVCTDADVPAAEVPDLMASLIDKSLLQRVGDGQRVRMLETIREFGIERLAERGELLDLRRRHADHVDELLRRAEPHLTRADQLPWFDRLTAERDNIVAALRFRCSEGDADGALAIALGLAGFSMMLGNDNAVAGWTGEALAVPGATDLSLQTTAETLHALHTASTSTDPESVDAAMQALRHTADHLDRIPSGSRPMNGLLRIAVGFFGGDEVLTRQVIEEELTSEDDWVRASARMFRANLSENNGEVEAMRADVQAALTEFRRIGERWGLANTLRAQALMHTLDGELAAAEAAYDEALDLMAQLRSVEDEAFLLVRIADIAMRRGDVARARSVMRRAYDSAQSSGSGIESVFVLSMFADFEFRNGHPERAREMHEETVRRTADMPASHPAQSHGRAIVYALAARFADGEGDIREAVRLGADAFAAAKATRDRPIAAAIGVVLAEIALHNGRAGDAAEMLGAAAALRGADDVTATDIAAISRALRGELGEQGYAQRYARGRGLDREAALARLDPAGSLAGLDVPASDMAPVTP